jgi:hypothetical protein
MEPRHELFIERSLAMLLVVLGVWMAWGLKVAGYVTMAFGVLIFLIWVTGAAQSYEESLKGITPPPAAPPPDEDI